MQGEREQERGMLREKDGIFIAAAVFIAAQRRGESAGAWLFAPLRMAEREGVGRREAALVRVSEREERLFGRRGKEERKAGEREGCFLSERVCVCVPEK